MLELIKSLEKAKYLLITAGAGMSVDSGIPDFRGKDGFYKNFKPENLTNEIFETDFADKLQDVIDQHKPHYGYKILQEAIKYFKLDYFVFTTNVDGYFQKSGFSDEKVCQIHGYLDLFQCSNNCSHRIFNQKLSFCPDCFAKIRPNVLMFDDYKFEESYVNRKFALLEDWLFKTKDELVILEFGAGIAVNTVRSFSQLTAKKYNAPFYRINIDGGDFNQTTLDFCLELEKYLK